MTSNSQITIYSKDFREGEKKRERDGGMGLGEGGSETRRGILKGWWNGVL